MGYIHLSIQRNQSIKSYILSNAEYLEEAWLAEVYENNTTHIIKQFQCTKFRNCFTQLHRFVMKLGKVTQISGTDVNEDDLTLLKNMLTVSSDGILPVNKPDNFLSQEYFWNWFKNDFRYR